MNSLRLFFLFCLSLAVGSTLAAPSIAEAGDCPTCTSSADCASSGAPGFCVVHDGPVGCGALVQLCCPGQACGIGVDGRPSCEAAGTCTVIENLDAGMGGTDTGMSGTDTGMGGTDTGMGGTDTGSSSGMDTGSTARDTGTSSGMDAGGPAASGGCACRAAHRSSGVPLALGVLGLCMAAILRRR